MSPTSQNYRVLPKVLDSLSAYSECWWARTVEMLAGSYKQRKAGMALCNWKKACILRLPFLQWRRGVQETCVQYTNFRVLPKRLVSISPHLKLWQNQHSLHAWQMLRMMESGKAVNTQDWSPLGWTGWISLQSKGLSRVFSNTTVQKHQFFRAQLSL